MERLPRELILLIGMNLKYNEINNLRRCSKYFNKLFKNKHFWITKIKNKYGINIQDLYGRLPIWKKYIRGIKTVERYYSNEALFKMIIVINRGLKEEITRIIAILEQREYKYIDDYGVCEIGGEDRFINAKNIKTLSNINICHKIIAGTENKIEEILNLEGNRNAWISPADNKPRDKNILYIKNGSIHLASQGHYNLTNRTRKMLKAGYHKYQYGYDKSAKKRIPKEIILQLPLINIINVIRGEI